SRHWGARRLSLKRGGKAERGVSTTRPGHSHISSGEVPLRSCVHDSVGRWGPDVHQPGILAILMPGTDYMGQGSRSVSRAARGPENGTRPRVSAPGSVPTGRKYRK